MQIQRNLNYKQLKIELKKIICVVWNNENLSLFLLISDHISHSHIEKTPLSCNIDNCLLKGKQNVSSRTI